MLTCDRPVCTYLPRMGVSQVWDYSTNILSEQEIVIFVTLVEKQQHELYLNWWTQVLFTPLL